MDKVFTFLGLVLVMSAILYMAGYASDNNSVKMLFDIIHGDFKVSEFWTKISSWIALAGAAVLVGSAIFGNASAAITGASILMTKFLVDFITDIIYILNKVAEHCDIVNGGLCAISYWVTFIILAPMALLFAYSLFRFAMGGND